MADDATTSTTDQTATPAEPTPPQKTQGDPADLGEGGKKALQAERQARQAAEKAQADLAAKLKAIEDKNLSDLEKAQRDAQEARDAATKAMTEALRFRVAAKHSISDEDAEIFLTGADEESINRQAERLVALRTPAKPGTPRPDPSQGARSSTVTGGPEQEFATFLKNQMGR